MKTLYLILALVGAVVPYIFFMQHFSSSSCSTFRAKGSASSVS